MGKSEENWMISDMFLLLAGSLFLSDEGTATSDTGLSVYWGI